MLTRWRGAGKGEETTLMPSRCPENERNGRRLVPLDPECRGRTGRSRRRSGTRTLSWQEYEEGLRCGTAAVGVGDLGSPADA